MFFKKNRVKVPEYIEDRVEEILNGEGVFKLESFFDEYQEILLTSGGGGPAGEGGEWTDTPLDRDLFINRFIGVLLWLIKYRTLSSSRNRPRKQAFLDLSFDIEMPDIVDRFFQRYDTGTIKESYDSMDLRCKKVFTGELQKAEEPRFLVSPLWAKNPDPHPFHIAAQIFVEDMGHNAVLAKDEAGNAHSFAGLIEKRFIEFTQPVANASADINFVWMFNR
jgi:hypothetical protein